MSIMLLPRLFKPQVHHIVAYLASDIPVDKIRSMVIDMDIEPHWNASGGQRAGDDDLEALRADVISIARDHGFPDRGDRPGFDYDCACMLAGNRFLKAAGGEVWRDDSWSWITSILLPDVVFWRFGRPVVERMCGGVRNTFQRLWLRAMIFDRGISDANRWLYLEKLTEDAMVQICERPGLAADHRLARFIALAWVQKSSEHQKMEAIMRKAMRRILSRNDVQMLGMLDDPALFSVITGAFDSAAGQSSS